jgi:hypothetical protein
MAFGGRAFGMSLGHEGGASGMELVPLKEETRKLAPLFHHARIR